MHKCTHCNYSSLRLLENAFENKQPNKCNQCSYASSPAGHLKTHLQTHSSEKPKKCNQRSYASSRESNLRSHMKRRTNQVSLLKTVISLMLLTKFMSTNSNKMFICSKLNYFQRFIFDGLPKFSNNVQSGASSQAEIGGAYFSRVTGSIQDPIAVPGPCEVTEFQILMAVFNTSNFSFAPHRHNAPAAP